VLGQDARDRIKQAAGRIGHDDRDRARRIGLRPSEARDGRQRNSARCQMQKSSTGTFHGVHSLVFAMSRAQSNAGTRCEQTAKLDV